MAQNGTDDSHRFNLPRTSHNFKIGHSRFTKTRQNAFNWRNWFSSEESMKDFLSRTTIPGISQWINHKSLGWKIIWMIVTVIGLAISIYQSTDALRGYSENAVVQAISFNLKPELIFPALTFCTNILIDTNEGAVDPVLKNLMDQAENVISANRSLSHQEIKTVTSSYRSDIMNIMLDWNNTDKITKTFGNSILFKHCQWKHKHCDFNDKDIFLQSESLRYGKCMTFNPGVVNSQTAQAGDSLIAILDMNPTSRLRLINLNYAILLVHPSGQPPIPKPENMNYLFPGKTLRLFVTGKQLNRLNVKKITKCVEPKDKSLGKSEFYSSKDMDYGYSREACLESCRFRDKMLRTEKPCLDPKMSLSTLIEKRKKFKNMSICNHVSDVNIRIDSVKECKCSELCKEPMLTSTAMTYSLLKLSDLGQNKRLPIPAEYYNEASLNITVVKVVLPTTEYMRITEEPKYSQTDFFGLIGGNLSLWVGVNVLCLIELIELIIIFLQKRFKKRPTRKRSPNLFKYVILD